MNTHSLVDTGRLIGLSLIASASLLTACNSSGGGSSTEAEARSANFESRSNQVEGPLDVVQNGLITDVVAEGIGSQLPAELGDGVRCLADSLNSLIDAPDAILSALTALPEGADPAAAFQGVADDVTGSLQRFADELQGALMALAQQGGCETVAGGGSPEPADSTGNPLAGTPLEALGAALGPLAGALNGFGGEGDDPNLTALAETLNPLLDQLAGAFDQVPAELAEAPIVGGLFMSLQTALGDVQTVLPAISDYDSLGTQNGLGVLLNNLLGNVLLHVLPVAQLEDATGQDISGQIEGVVNQVAGTLTPVLGQALSPVFDQLLNGALSPVLNPVEGVLTQILGTIGGEGGLPI